MVKRGIEVRVLEDLAYFPVVGLIGPRQVGKTTLAKVIGNQSETVQVCIFGETHIVLWKRPLL